MQTQRLSIRKGQKVGETAMSAEVDDFGVRILLGVDGISTITHWDFGEARELAEFLISSMETVLGTETVDKAITAVMLNIADSRWPKAEKVGAELALEALRVRLNG